MSKVPKIALVGCGYWGKNLCRNFHDLGALSAVVDATKNGQATARLIAPDLTVASFLDDILNLRPQHLLALTAVASKQVHRMPLQPVVREIRPVDPAVLPVEVPVDRAVDPVVLDLADPVVPQVEEDTEDTDSSFFNLK